MFNKNIHMLFNISILIPFVFGIGIVKVLQKNIILGSIFILLALIISVTQIAIINYSIKNLVPQKINISNISQDKENWIVVIYMTYFVPFIEGYLNSSFENSTWILIIGCVVLIILSGKIVNNPILSILGYKAYIIETEHKVDMTLLSKRKLRNSKSINRVIRMFEYMVIEVR